MARQAIRDTLLCFPDDEVAAASWRFQRAFIPLAARLLSAEPLEDLSAQARSRMSAEDQIRWRMDPTWFLMHGVTASTIRKLAEIDPWSVEQLKRETTGAQEAFANLSPPQGEWVGPIGDPWLGTWKDVDHLQMCALAVLGDDPSADDLLQDEDVAAAILRAGESKHQILSRVGEPLAKRLGLV